MKGGSRCSIVNSTVERLEGRMQAIVEDIEIDIHELQHYIKEVENEWHDNIFTLVQDVNEARETACMKQMNITDTR